MSAAVTPPPSPAPIKTFKPWLLSLSIVSLGESGRKSRVNRPAGIDLGNFVPGAQNHAATCTERATRVGMPCAFIVSLMPLSLLLLHTTYTRYCSLCFWGFGGKAFLFCFLEMINALRRADGFRQNKCCPPTTFKCKTLSVDLLLNSQKMKATTYVMLFI